MTVWCHLPTITISRRALQIAGLLALCVALTTTLMLSVVTRAAPGVNKTLSFQGRLLNASGGVVADGHYNIQFKLYQDGGGTLANDPNRDLQWTETYVNNGNNNGVEVKNGYFSVSLGSNNPFGTDVDWNQDTLWLSMNVAGSSASCSTFNTGSCAADGEMLPMKRITATPFSLNSAALNGLTSSNFIQMAQGLQTDASAAPSIAINKTGAGNFLELQSAGTSALTIAGNGDITFGAATDHYLGVAGSTAGAGKSLTLYGGNGGSDGDNIGGDLVLQGGNGGGVNGEGGNVTIDAGATNGNGAGGAVNIGVTQADAIYLGSGNSAYIQIGNPALSSDTQYINIGNNNAAGGTTNVVIGSTYGATGGTTKIQSKDNTTIATDGVDRATFDKTGKLFLGNGESNIAPLGFTIQGTNSSTNGVNGGSIAVQGGSATVGNANGGNLTLSGGTGAGTGTSGLVVLTTPTFQSSGATQVCIDANTSFAITQASVDGNSVIPVSSTSTASCTISLPDPSNTTAGRIIYVTAANGSNDFALSVNGGGAGNLTSMRQNTTATMVWNGNDWTVAGASNSTTLQSAYNNTLQSAGAAEIIVSNGSNANGLTIRDSSTNPVNGTLLEVQNAGAATLFSVNSNIPEYSTNAGAETVGASANTFPANTWSSYGTSSVSRYTTAGNYIATGQGSVQVTTTGSGSQGVKNRLASALTPNMTYNVSYSVRLASGSSSGINAWYSADGTATTLNCTTTPQTPLTSTWTKVNCAFKAPAGGISANNSIIIGSVESSVRTYHIDNISVTIAADSNYATDGSVRDNTNFATNWSTSGAGSTVTRNATDGNDASDSAQAVITSGANAGLRNKLSISPLPSSLYRVSTYVKASTALTDFKVRYSRDAGTSFVECVDYNTQTITTSGWTQVTCFINTDATTASNPYLYLVQGSSAARTLMADTLSMTLFSNTTSNVQIGGGANGGPTTLLTLDKSASAPIADNNDALLGSMYYDTTIGRLQCYEADGWGSCGSAPDNIITISPEYSNAVMHGTGVGTMTSDICSDALDINDATNGPQVCGTNETRNFYKWTSPQASAQTYSIFVTYQLPTTFKSFTSGTTSLQAKTDNANSSVGYEVYKSNSSGLQICGSAVSVATGNVAWQTGLATGSADPSTCGFAAGDSVVFKITASSRSNANAYIGNLGFTFNNR